MNGSVQPGSQPASGGMSNGSVTGGFEMMATGMGVLGGGAGVSPPGSTVGGLSITDVSLEQALARMQELVRENADLREYLKENNEMMKKQFETLSQWKQKVHDANVLNREKFEQTRALITALRSENEELQVTVREGTDKEESLASRIKMLETEINTLKTAKAASDQLAINVVKQAEEQGVEVGEDETQMREMVYVASAEKEERIMELEEEVTKLKEEINQMKDRSIHLEHDNAQFRSNAEQLMNDIQSIQLLKDQLQKENQDLQSETVELRKQMQSMLAETKNSLQRNQTSPLMTLPLQGQAKAGDPRVTIAGSNQEGAMGRMPNHTIEDWQESSAAVTAEVEQLRKQLDAEKQQVDMLHADIAAKELEISQLQSDAEQQTKELKNLQDHHDEKVRQLQREHESRLEKIELQKMEDSTTQRQQVFNATHAEDVQTLRSQVLTLINEVHETQNKLGAAQRAIDMKNNRLKEVEAYSAQMVMESRSNVQQLQQALIMRERQFTDEQQNHDASKRQMNELRQSFNQLVSDYRELLDTFDKYKDEQEQRTKSSAHQNQQMDTINHLTAQVLAAEEAINMREDRIKKLMQDIREKDETMDVLRAQAEVFESDFKAERDSRTQLAQEKDRLAQELEAEKLNSQNLVEQLTRYTQQQLQDMQLRANQGIPVGHYFQPNFGLPANRPDPYQQAGGHGGGGDGSGGGDARNINNLSAAAGGQNYGPGHHVPGGGPDRRTGGHNPPMQAGYPVAQHHQPQVGGGGGGGLGMAEPRQHDEEEHTSFICPSCNQRLPDFDTLNIHVQDCLEQSTLEGQRH